MRNVNSKYAVFGDPRIGTSLCAAGARRSQRTGVCRTRCGSSNLKLSVYEARSRHTTSSTYVMDGARLVCAEDSRLRPRKEGHHMDAVLTRSTRSETRIEGAILGIRDRMTVGDQSVSPPGFPLAHGELTCAEYEFKGPVAGGSACVWTVY